MKKILFSIQNTYRAVKLLSDPNIADVISRELGTTPKKNLITQAFESSKVGQGSILPHKHYMVQVLN